MGHLVEVVAGGDGADLTGSNRISCGSRGILALNVSQRLARRKKQRLWPVRLFS
jgi:hypothetical protein